ncbi:hypothetical protein CPB84DRAFT_1671293 [Gymnopilus junonius]|uniref:Uncharacterized protein n=1 Tax=Gymnopilus junonius TaxID=109634 RepID=A0A9P5P0Y3_GYMJU|nr:hypothetical protein CPB84DRAFT_1671293 [Gymnopilus junonius]
MYGELDAKYVLLQLFQQISNTFCHSSAYSLSGHISLSISSYYSLFESRRRARFLLQSLELTFEGQSEIHASNTGYSSLRLCSITRELAPSMPIELTNQGYEDDADPCVWNFVFNLPIPGWLPATTRLGMEDIGVRYGLYATAKFTNVEEEQSTSYFASLCAPFRSRIKSAEASKQIKVCRFISAPQVDVVETSTLNYLVHSTPASSPGLLPKDRIPAEVLSKIQVLASVPEYVNVKDNSVPVTLRLRTKDLCEEECQKIQVAEVAVDIIQEEKCRYRPSASSLARYPLPTKEMQPPNLPLRDPHPISSMYEVGLYVSDDLSESLARSFSLLHPSETGRYKLDRENYAFLNDARTDIPPTWYTMDTTLPFVHRNPTFGDDADNASEWAGSKNLRPSSHSPLYSVIHEVAISLTCTYDLEGKGGKVATEKLSFRIPLNFTHVAPRLQADPSRYLGHSSPPMQNAGSDALPNLPVYSQLFDSNGERKVDYSVPLPLYTPRSLTPTPESRDTPLVDVSSEPGPISDMNVYHNGLGGANEKMTTPVLLPFHS